MFLILVVIQFVVITNGAGRVAEVAARFTLDAMPGKQMAIDADLNAGQITDEEARRRREQIQREADFYGAMDGASKFVKGDADRRHPDHRRSTSSAASRSASSSEGMALRGGRCSTYTLLTIGDGLVAQIPALLISTATGIIVTRSSSESDLALEGDVGLVAGLLEGALLEARHDAYDVSAHAQGPDRLVGLGVLEQHVGKARLRRTIGLVAGRGGVGEVVGDLILPHLFGEHARGAM